MTKVLVVGPGQKIFIKGYMYPTQDTRGLKTFLLVKDNAQCCFGGNPKINDMILVTMQNGKGVDYHQGLLMSVGGVFHCQRSSGPAGRVSRSRWGRRAST